MSINRSPFAVHLFKGKEIPTTDLGFKINLIPQVEDIILDGKGNKYKVIKRELDSKKIVVVPFLE